MARSSYVSRCRIGLITAVQQHKQSHLFHVDELNTTGTRALISFDHQHHYNTNNNRMRQAKTTTWNNCYGVIGVFILCGSIACVPDALAPFLYVRKLCVYVDFPTTTTVFLHLVQPINIQQKLMIGKFNEYKWDTRWTDFWGICIYCMLSIRLVGRNCWRGHLLASLICTKKTLSNILFVDLLNDMND